MNGSEKLLDCQQTTHLPQGGPLLVINGVKTPININSLINTGVITPYKWSYFTLFLKLLGAHLPESSKHYWRAGWRDRVKNHVELCDLKASKNPWGVGSFWANEIIFHLSLEFPPLHRIGLYR